MPALLLYGDTERSAAMRHEVPLEIVDPFLLVDHDGRVLVLTNVLESERIAAVRPEAELLLTDDLGFRELVMGGMPRHDALLEVVARAVARWGIAEFLVPPELPLAIADRLRADGVVVTVDVEAFERRRRAKTPAELAGIRRAQRAAEAGMAAASRAIWGAERRDGRLWKAGGSPLTAEDVRADIRAACAAAGAPAPPNIMVVSTLSGGGHDPGSGPLPADLPIVVDLWPRDEATTCWADMTRTFVAGAVSDEVAALRDVVRDAIETVRAAVRPGVTGRELYDLAAGVVEAAGFPTQRTRAEGEVLTHGFYFGLGHGVGLEVHEPPSLGLSGQDLLVAGDVLAVEPGIEGLPAINGVRYEDLLLVTEDGCETLTDFPYALTP